MQLEIDFIASQKDRRRQVFLDFVSQKKTDGYEVLQCVPVACACTLKKDLHWFMTIRHKTDPSILHVSEYESTEVRTITVTSQYDSRLNHTVRRRGWALVKQFQINIAHHHQ
jgi:hypothetical protein